MARFETDDPRLVELYEAAIAEQEIPRTPGAAFRPTARIAFGEAAERLLAELPEDERGSHGAVGTRARVHDVVARLVETGALSTRFGSAALERASDGWHPQLGYALIERCLAEGEQASAVALAERCEAIGQTRPYAGWRRIAEFHARRAEADAVLELWPRLGATSDQQEIDRMRGELIEATSRLRGWPAAVELAGHLRMGSKRELPARIHTALAPIAEQGDPVAMQELLEREPTLAPLEERHRLHLVILSMRAAAPGAPEQDHPLLAPILERVLAMDPADSKEASRIRDWLLVECWPLIGSGETLARARAAARAPAMRRELTRLRRAV